LSTSRSRGASSCRETGRRSSGVSLGPLTSSHPPEAERERESRERRAGGGEGRHLSAQLLRIVEGDLNPKEWTDEVLLVDGVLALLSPPLQQTTCSSQWACGIDPLPPDGVGEEGPVDDVGLAEDVEEGGAEEIEAVSNIVSMSGRVGDEETRGDEREEAVDGPEASIGAQSIATEELALWGEPQDAVEEEDADDVSEGEDSSA
jgi:hypothetical protein